MKTIIVKKYETPTFSIIRIDKDFSLVMLSNPPSGPGETAKQPDDPDKDREDIFKTQFDE
jgi:hypothetical protein